MVEAGTAVQTYTLHPLSHFSEHLLDAVFHVFILFTALSALLQFVISTIYSGVMTQQVSSILDKSLDREQIAKMIQPMAARRGLSVQQVQGLLREAPITAALESMWNQSSQAELDGKVLQPGDDFGPFWEQRILQYDTGEGGGARVLYRTSEQVRVNNDWIWRYAHTISVFLFLAFIFLVWIMKKSIDLTTSDTNTQQIWTPTSNVLKNNLLLIFPAILLAEGGFFEIVAKKYIPILPSDFVSIFAEILSEKEVTRE